MMAIVDSLNAHNCPIFQPILMILVSKLMVYRALADKTYLSLGLLSPLRIRYQPAKYQKILLICCVPWQFSSSVDVFLVCACALG